MSTASKSFVESWSAGALTITNELKRAEPTVLPDGAFNHLADNWRPLFAIAEIAGGEWPQRCADAFAKLTSNDADADSIRVELLADIRNLFHRS